MVDKIGDIVFKVGMGIGIIIFSIAALKYVNRPVPTQEPITITIKEYDKNEIQVESYMDSVHSLTYDQQLHILEELAREHVARYNLDTGHNRSGRKAILFSR